MMVLRLTYAMWTERTGYELRGEEARENKFPGLFRMTDINDPEPKWLRKTTRTEEAFAKGTDGWRKVLRVDLQSGRYFIVNDRKKSR